MTKPTLCQTLKNPARQGSKLAAKGAYIDVSDRRLQAKIPSALPLSEGIFVFAGFISSLIPDVKSGIRLYIHQDNAPGACSMLTCTFTPKPFIMFA